MNLKKEKEDYSSHTTNKIHEAIEMMNFEEIENYVQNKNQPSSNEDTSNKQDQFNLNMSN